MNQPTPNCVNSELVENMEIENVTDIEVRNADELQNATGTGIVVEHGSSAEYSESDSDSSPRRRRGGEDYTKDIVTQDGTDTPNPQEGKESGNDEGKTEEEQVAENLLTKHFRQSLIETRIQGKHTPCEDSLDISEYEQRDSTDSNTQSETDPHNPHTYHTPHVRPQHTKTAIEGKHHHTQRGQGREQTGDIKRNKSKKGYNCILGPECAGALCIKIHTQEHYDPPTRDKRGKRRETKIGRGQTPTTPRHRAGSRNRTNINFQTHHKPPDFPF